VNTLTLNIATSWLAQSNCGQTVLGKVEKYQGTPPEVAAFTAPMGSA